ncbi:MAG: hypothetical protein ABF778_04110 [Liquorilactobacillus hordei]|uniref:hypothetical protein n=1 Tax=Liquorilactobacillus hordei TaxID=468911 RepID=UPI0039EBABB3
MSILEIIALFSLILLMGYNIRLGLMVKKLRDKLSKGKEIELTESTNKEIIDAIKTRKKWTILSQCLFWISIVMMLYGSMGLLIYFLDLYTIAVIYINLVNRKVFTELIKL